MTPVSPLMINDTSPSTNISNSVDRKEKSLTLITNGNDKMAVTVKEANSAMSYISTPKSSPFSERNMSSQQIVNELPSDLSHPSKASMAGGKKGGCASHVTPSEKSVKLDETPRGGCVTKTLEDMGGSSSRGSESTEAACPLSPSRHLGVMSRRGGFSGNVPTSPAGAESRAKTLQDYRQPPTLLKLASASGAVPISLRPRIAKDDHSNGSKSGGSAITSSRMAHTTSSVLAQSVGDQTEMKALALPVSKSSELSSSIPPSMKLDSASTETSSTDNTPQSPVPPLASGSAFPLTSPFGARISQQENTHLKNEQHEPLSPQLPSPPKVANDQRKGLESDVNGNDRGLANDQRKELESDVNGSDRGGGVTPPPPANFAQDYGRPELSSLSFDASNVLSWLSPTANSLFSPGAFNKSPRVMFSPSTPKQHSKLFSDLGVNPGPSPNGSKNRNSLSLQQQSCFNMICVSPLASSKRGTIGNGISNAGRPIPKMPDTPICFKDVFASPKTDQKTGLPITKSNEIPTLTESTSTGQNDLESKLNHEKDMAERDLMMDEDMSVLLQLAQTTPKAEKGSMRTYRSPRHLKMHFGISSHPGGPPSSLQLPFIGVKGASPSRLQRKSGDKGSGSADDRSGAPISIRNTTPGGSKKKPTPIKSSSVKNLSSKGSKQSIPAALSPVPGRYPGPYPGHPLPPHLSHPPPPHTIYPLPSHMPIHAMPGHPTYPHYPYAPPGHPRPYMNYPVPTPVGSKASPLKKSQKNKNGTNGKRPLATQVGSTTNKRPKKTSGRGKGSGTKRKPSQASAMTASLNNPADRQKSAAAISAMNAANGHKNDKAAALASAILRGVTMRPSGKWQAQLYYAGKSRYIGVFDTREKAALAYEIAREKLKTDKTSSEQGSLSAKDTEAHVNAARKAAFAGVNETDPRIMGK